MDRTSIEIFFMIFIAILAIIVVLVFVNNTLKQKRDQNMLLDKNKKIYLFYANWCEHSADFFESGIWQSLLEKYKGIYDIQAIEIESNHELIKTLDVNRVPILYLVYNGKKKRYYGEKTLSNIIQFIDTSFNSII